jgi:hypothetical protein
VLAVHRGGFARRPGVRLERIGDDEWGRARTFHHAVRALRDGRYVYTTLDGFGEGGYDGATIDVPVLGRTMSLARGGPALARITGVPIVPMVARWRGTRVEIVYGDPIDPAQGEDAMAAAIAPWLDRYLRAFPGEISPRTLETLREPQRR